MISSMNIGGVEKSLLSLLDNIPRHRYEITVLMLNKDGDFLEYLPEDIKQEEAEWYRDIKPIIMKNPYYNILRYAVKGKFSRIPSFIKTFNKAIAANDRYIFYEHVLEELPYCMEEYDVAISYAGPTEIIDTYISHKVKAKKKLAWVHFDVSKHEINDKLYEKLYGLYDKVFVVSKEAKEKLDERIPSVNKKSEVMMNVVSKEIISSLSKETCEVKDEHEITKIVTVGRISEEKGQDLAIKALVKLRKEGYKVKWYCVGDGKYKKDCKKLIRKNKLKNEFILIGAKPNPYPYMEMADIYVQTSRHEGYCLTLAEAKCLNKTIITTDFTGAREQIVNEVNGYIVEADEEKIFQKIKELIDSINNGDKDNLLKSDFNESITSIYQLEKFIEGDE